LPIENVENVVIRARDCQTLDDADVVSHITQSLLVILFINVSITVRFRISAAEHESIDI